MTVKISPGLSRRTLLARVGAVSAAVLAGGCQPVAGCAPVRTGLQLYSVRDAMMISVPQTLERVAMLGYGAVEFAGYFDQSPVQIAGLLAANGLVAPSAHVDARQARLDPARIVADGVAAGHDYLVIAWIPPEDRTSLSDWQAWADVLNRFGEACRSAGLRCAYHNHDFEFADANAGSTPSGLTPWAVLQARCDPQLVAFEIDTYWAGRADQDAAALVAAAPERFPLCHIKDHHGDGSMAVLGEGMADFGPVLAARGAAGFVQCYAELDNPDQPFGFAATAQPALRALLQANRACPE
ncbi:TIM barrel protein [Maricaulis sp.]|uniref:sugar phosphate isomerase/epimerase family protein n=1 Tax=Maricaulis sp. TaxID=1486257 RepID=UPI0025C73EFC|nr:TIM barrel protein [Maricaulis sp.]